MKKQTEEPKLTDMQFHSDINGHKLMLFFSNKRIYELDFRVNEEQDNCAGRLAKLSCLMFKENEQ